MTGTVEAPEPWWMDPARQGEDPFLEDLAVRLNGSDLTSAERETSHVYAGRLYAVVGGNPITLAAVNRSDQQMDTVARLQAVVGFEMHVDVPDSVVAVAAAWAENTLSFLFDPEALTVKTVAGAEEDTMRADCRRVDGRTPTSFSKKELAQLVRALRKGGRTAEHARAAMSIDSSLCAAATRKMEEGDHDVNVALGQGAVDSWMMLRDHLRFINEPV